MNMNGGMQDYLTRDVFDKTIATLATTEELRAAIAPLATKAAMQDGFAAVRTECATAMRRHTDEIMQALNLHLTTFRHAMKEDFAGLKKGVDSLREEVLDLTLEIRAVKHDVAALKMDVAVQKVGDAGLKEQARPAEPRV